MNRCYIVNSVGMRGRLFLAFYKCCAALLQYAPSLKTKLKSMTIVNDCLNRIKSGQVFLLYPDELSPWAKEIFDALNGAPLAKHSGLGKRADRH